MPTLLTFLGTGDYKEVTYVWQDAEGEKTFTTHLFPLAADVFFQPSRVLVCVTPQVRAHRHFQALSQALGDRLHPVDIPEGTSEAELWDIFQRIADALGGGEEVILDITHAFRSIPLMVFTIAAYLRQTQRASISRIVYGAYEAREGERAPVFDLTPLLDLLDWLADANALLRRADARGLAERMDTVHRRLWKGRLSPEQALPRNLQTIATKLRDLSLALHLSRPLDTMKNAHALLPLLSRAQEEFTTWAKPFAVIVEQVRREIEPLAHAQTERLDAENLRTQLALVQYYLKKDLVGQATLLAREWVVSWALLQRGQGDWLQREDREAVEGDLNKAVQRLRNQQAEVPPWMLSIWQTLGGIWDTITQLRNDLAHCGMRKDAASMDTIQKRAQGLPQLLEQLLQGAPQGALWGRKVVIDLKAIYGEVAQLDALSQYLERVREQAGEGNDVVLTGQAPVWLYLAVAHALHGKARRLWYSSPVTGEVLIFDHAAR